MNRRHWLRQSGSWALGAGTLGLSSAWSAVFMEAEQAMRLLMPDADQYMTVTMALTQAQMDQMSTQIGRKMPIHFSPKVWACMREGQRIGWFMTDRVIGKYDLIDFAVAFDGQGRNAGLEILAYRESHGGEIRQTAWRQQFKGRIGPGGLRFGTDIRNISGATLSCQHVTEGVQRLSALTRLLT